MGKFDPSAQKQKPSNADATGTAVPDSAAIDTHPGPPIPRRGAGYPFLSPSKSAEEMGWLGPYRILDVLGEGAMGIVFRAEKPPLKRDLALKVMRPESAREIESRRRFLREAQAAAALHHDHVIPIFDFGEDGGIPYLAMPLLPGETLQQRLRRQDAGSEKSLTMPEIVRIGREIAEGLAAAHVQDLVHRDIKPANLWLETKESPPTALGGGSPFRIRILDFGLARGPEDSLLTKQGAIVGTPAFMAPEQVRGEPAVARSDLFSLGAVLYLLTTGEMPFPGDHVSAVLFAVLERDPPAPAKVRRHVPRALSRLIMRLLEKDARDRPASASEVAAELVAIERGEPVAGIPEASVSGRGNVAVIVMALLAAIVITGGLWLWSSLSPPPSSTTPIVPKKETRDRIEPDKKPDPIETDPNAIPSKKGVIDDD